MAALIRLLQRLQAFLQPYLERYEAAREAFEEWWAVREERCAQCASIVRVHQGCPGSTLMWRAQEGSATTL